MWPLGTIQPGLMVSPPAAVWPTSFFAGFESLSKNTSGLFMVNSSAEMLMLMDGTRDHLCSAFHNNTACSMLTTDGWKYLIWPELGKCCKCCSYANGCGPLLPKWVTNQTGNTRYEGIENVTYNSTSFPCHKWEVVGLSADWPNYYWMHTDGNINWPNSDGMPCATHGWNSPADDDYIFDPNSTSATIPSSFFEKPAYCADDVFCGNEVCDAPPS